MALHLFSGARELGEAHRPSELSRERAPPAQAAQRETPAREGDAGVGGKGGVGSLLRGVWPGPRPQQPVYPANFHFGTQLQPPQVQGRGRGERKPQVGLAASRPPPLSEPRAEPCVRSQPAPIRCLWCPAWPTAHNDRPGGVPSSSGGWRPESTPDQQGGSLLRPVPLACPRRLSLCPHLVVPLGESVA